jgi:hypothetical protein
MVAEVFAGLGSIKAAFDIAKGLKDIDATRRNTAIIELQEKILSAQAEQSELIETIGDLKKRVTELETWEAEKQRYELKQEFIAWCEQHGVTSIAELQPLYPKCFA